MSCAEVLSTDSGVRTSCAMLAAISPRNARRACISASFCAAARLRIIVRKLVAKTPISPPAGKSTSAGSCPRSLICRTVSVNCRIGRLIRHATIVPVATPSAKTSAAIAVRARRSRVAAASADASGSETWTSSRGPSRPRTGPTGALPASMRLRSSVAMVLVATTTPPPVSRSSTDVSPAACATAA